MNTLATILRDNWEWRKQIGRLAIFDLVKKSRGAVLGWAWFFIKPAVYIFCFWFALDFGLRAGTTDPGQPPYILWLSAGLIPWFFIQDMLGGGIDVLHRYPYLVNKIKFPISGISSIYTLGAMIVELMLIGALFIGYFATGQTLDIYLLQVPILLVLMFLFWDLTSIGLSQLTGISKDFKNFMGALGTPFFWLSGVLFNVESIPIAWIQALLDINPITFFVSSFRAAFYDKTWFWEDTSMTIGFAFAFLVTLLLTLFLYKKFNEEVSDVL